MRTLTATLIEGDGVGPEIMDATLAVLDALGARFEWQRFQGGMRSYESCGDPLPEAMLASIRETGIALKSPLTTPVGNGFRSANVRLREEFQLFANVRPAKAYAHSRRAYDNVDLLLIRENTEGLYVGVEHYIPIAGDPRAAAEAIGIITRAGCLRIAEFAFDYALSQGRKKVTIIHKANILKALTGLFLDTCMEVGRKYEGRLVVEERIVDNTAMQLVTNPHQFDVLLTTNMFGDILSDQIAGLVGGLGLAPGANIGRDVAIFEAIHGSAPDIAGKGVVNPTALFLAAAMMLDFVQEEEMANRLRAAISDVLGTDRLYTQDLGGEATSQAYTEAVINRLR